MPPRSQSPSLDHLIALTDGTGVIQHATFDVPNRSTGYCTDDVARALIVAVNATRTPATEAAGARLVTTYLAFLHDAQLPDGWFHNFMGYDRTWQDHRGSADCIGRAIWALGYCMRFAPRDSWRRLARRMVLASVRHLPDLGHLRAQAYAALGLVHAVEASPDDQAALRPVLATTAQTIAIAFEREADRTWVWCEPILTYDNARLPEALVRAGVALNDAQLRQAGLRMLDFYTSIVTENGMFVPVGNDGWYVRGGVKARFGQQPLEAAGMIAACFAARAATGEARFMRSAEMAYDWFFGRNSAGAVLVANGGCADGIDADGVSANMGAESTLAYLHSAMAFVQPPAPILQLVR